MIGYLALYGWPIVTGLLFKRFSLIVALPAALVAGYLLLPIKTGINLPLLPAFDKFFMIGFAPLLMVMLILRMRAQNPQGRRWLQTHEIAPGWIPQDKVVRVLLAMLFIGAFLTVATNGDRVSYGSKVLPPLALYDGFSRSLDLIVMLLPLLLARKFLATPEAHRAFLGVLCVMGLLYSIPALYESRMSPQLNKMVYGFFPHDWRQHIRSGGYRPVVFLSHGLLLGIFLTCSVLATAGYMRVKSVSKSWLVLLAIVWLLGVLVLSYNLAALIFAVILLPVVLLFAPRNQLMVAAIISGLVLTYPMLRSTELVPTSKIINYTSKIDAARANSLAFRIENEDLFLSKARQRALLGWGGWGRSRIFDQEGREVAVADGTWVIVMGLGGWVGYIGIFGLLTLPTLMLYSRRRRQPISMATSALSVVLAGNLVDLLLNSGLTPVLWGMAGALVGHLEYKPKTDAETQDLNQAGTPAKSERYRRALSAPPPVDKVIYTRQSKVVPPVSARVLQPKQRAKASTAHSRTTRPLDPTDPENL